jgi:hypothetical protein
LNISKIWGTSFVVRRSFYNSPARLPMMSVVPLLT